jgi:predicted O-methyltransferase YrrM
MRRQLFEDVLPLRLSQKLLRLYKKARSVTFVDKGVSVIDVAHFNAAPRSDISEHLNLLYLYLQAAKPLEILELGTRGGESTRVFEKYCREMNIVGRSIDLDEAPAWLLHNKNWRHFAGDDILLGKSLALTRKWPDGADYKKLDFIFLDSSHEYLHTKEELEVYVPLLSEGTGAIAFHDTNLTSSPTLRLDGTVGFGWDNKRGVARAIEEYFDFKFEERTLQTQLISEGKFLFYHQPWCNGFSLIIPAATATYE